MVFQALKKVLRNPRYTFLALGTSVAVFAFAVWFPNFSLIVKVMSHPGVPFSQKFDLPVNLLGSIATNFTLLSASYTIIIAALFGINLALIVYYIRRRIAKVKQGGIATGFLGITSGALGMGCAACGSLLLTSILPLLGASGVLAYLPLGGEEFGLLGVGFLGASLYIMAKQIQNPAVCKIN